MDEDPQQQETASLARSIGHPTLEAGKDGRRVERLPGVDLRIKAGSPLFLRLGSPDRRYEGRVLGLEPFEYIIVRSRLPRDVQANLRPGSAVTLQVQVGGALYGFRSEVLNRITNPAPLLFLAYPATVARLTLRRNARVNVTLPGAIHGAYGDHEVVVLDLALTGCRFAARSSLTSPLRGAKPGDRLVLDCALRLPGAEEDARFMGPLVLRRVEEDHGRISMGGQFADLPEDAAKILRDFLTHMCPLLGA